MIKSLSHVTFTVKDIAKTGQFLSDIFNAKQVYASDEKEFSIMAERFYLIGEIWVAIMQTDDKIERSYNHIAFKIDDANFDLYEQRLIDHKIEMLPPRSRVEGEGRSLYFYDFDNHLFELHTGTLDERLVRYQKAK